MSAMPLKMSRPAEVSPRCEPQLKKRCTVHKNLNRWCLPFPGTDAEVVGRTQRHLFVADQRRPVQYLAYITFPSIWTAITVVFAGAFLFIFSKVTCLRKLLLRHPRLCSFGIVTHDHPKEGVLDDMCFQYEMLGEGWEAGSEQDSPPNKRVVGRVSVSGADPAYVGTAVVVVCSALAILYERDKIPINGGALTPGVAFRNTSLIANLQRNNVKFEIAQNQ